MGTIINKGNRHSIVRVNSARQAKKPLLTKSGVLPKEKSPIKTQKASAKSKIVLIPIGNNLQNNERRSFTSFLLNKKRQLPYLSLPNTNLSDRL
jgi:hypothetical protein